MAYIITRGMKGDIHGTCKSSEAGRQVARSNNWVEGYWETLGCHIKDKQHLKQVCQDIERKTGNKFIPKAFMKPSSQGKGVEWSF